MTDDTTDVTLQGWEADALIEAARIVEQAINIDDELRREVSSAADSLERSVGGESPDPDGILDAVEAVLEGESDMADVERAVKGIAHLHEEGGV
jgi:hypothetical protein